MKYLFSCAAVFLWVSVLTGSETPMGKSPSFRIDFSKAKKEGKAVTGWTYKGKLGTDDAQFSIQEMDGKKVLVLASRKGTGSLLYDISGVDLEKYPCMRWKWRVDVLPKDADGNLPDKDDQAIGIYVGSGSTFSQESIAFRWETKTEKGKTGFVKYGMGAVKVHWVCVRNEKDKLKHWYVDECNLYEELKKIFKGRIPRENVVITLSANSQYTGTSSAACLEYIEFTAAPLNPKTAEKRKK